MQLFQQAKAELIRSNVDRRHPFRYFVLSTFGEYPESRTVVKRGMEVDLKVLFFTDTRSPKVQQIMKNSKITALFYHPKKQLQIRMKGEAEIISKQDERHSPLLERIRQSESIGDYTTRLPPSTPLPFDNSRTDYLKLIHFTPIYIIPHELDILQLDREGHTRAMYMHKENDWQEILLTP